MFDLMSVSLRGAPWALEKHFRSAVERADHENIFNPSLAVSSKSVRIAFRSLPPGASKPFHAVLATARLDAPEEWALTNLTSMAAEHGVGPVADPKLFRWGGQDYVTFNTGYSPIQNEIYVMGLNSARPQKCVLTTGRQRVEKNWAFTEDEDGRLSVVYQLAPLVELKAVSGEPGSGEQIVFERYKPAANNQGTRLAIGSPVINVGDRRLLVAHEKIRIGSRRAYVGRFVEIHRGEPRLPISVSPRRLVHSYRALIPQVKPHNPNLFSATYFSGLASVPNGFLLGYGVNDKDFGFRIVQEADLWN